MFLARLEGRVVLSETVFHGTTRLNMRREEKIDTVSCALDLGMITDGKEKKDSRAHPTHL
jgi:hypothetical protein